ncbi:MAG: glycosyltransferase family 2 protein [Bacteroidales bacterium]|nr:glycosyltransferase family 2 protein [Bacteroidales bacterium]MCF8351346.1 glycosyltransferase family 2 protein [Bacteroidales bacterium]MCF8375651.1 glycosyltransferase family 2 protein [Bacteroidales bacterium]MCF8400766.1 glycosyltransferase family 2 protein [Bacteroidales bacterium]
MEIAIMIIYGFALTLILFYSLMQMSLVINYLKYKKRKQEIPDSLLNGKGRLPLVTIQLPVFNEKYVVERLLNAVAKFDYPRQRMEIQLLDDSTDETVEISRKKVDELKKQGFNIELLQREKRIGFKAGALDEGMQKAKGEYIAIFDADFIPEPDFLKRTLPYFGNDRTGVVQTRWGHINKDYSLLTRLQAFGLDAHFSVEQGGRNQGGHFINFNGTAGVWRRTTIDDAGGWEHDTLTEDLDLSYRAQMKGWKFVFLEEVETPAELPIVMSAVKSQQFRWNKGGAENFRKMLGRIFSTPGIPFKTRMHGFFHLLNSAIFLCVLTAALLSIPLLFVKHANPEYNMIFDISSIFLLCTIILMIFYWNAYREKTRTFFVNAANFFREFILFLSTTMGLSFHNSVAVVEGYLGKKSSFVRTPKFNVVNPRQKIAHNNYVSRSLNLVTFIEGILCLYFLFGIVSGIIMREYGLLPFHLMLCWGFGYVFYYSLKN